MPLRLCAFARAALLCALPSLACAAPLDSSQLLWTQKHSAANTAAPGFFSEIVSFDSTTRTLWVAGVTGVDVLDARTGSSLGFIDTRAFGSINSVAIHGGIAALAMEAGAPDRRNPGQVLLFDTGTRALASGINRIQVGSLPDMLTFTPDGSKLLVANEGTPNAVADQAYSAPDPVGTMSIIDMATRSASSVSFGAAPRTGQNIRTNAGMDFEPEYIAVNAAGTRVYVTLQEANAIGIVNLQNQSVEKVVGLGAKDFSAPGNEIDTRNGGGADFVNVPVKGLYQPDGLATYQVGGATYIVTANEGDFREDNGDRANASVFGAVGDLAGLRVSSTDSSAGNLFAAGARSFSIRDADGNLVYDSGSILDREAANQLIYADNRSPEKGVEPEGVELMSIGGKTYAFIGLERTTEGAVAVFDISDPQNASFVRLLRSGTGALRPEGLEGFTMDGVHYLAVANEGAAFATSGTTLFSLAPIPEPGTYALLMAGLLAVGAAARRQSR